MQEPGFPTGSSLPPSSPRKTRRQRTVFSAQQLRVLEEFFGRKRYGTYEERETLAARLNLQEYRVQVWLKNRRAKDCRLQRLRGHPGERAHAGPQKLGAWAPQAAPEPQGPAYQEDPVLPASPVLPPPAARMQEPGFPTGSSLSPSAPRKRTRRRRTVFSAQQLRALEEFFGRERYGTYEEREALAARLSLQEYRVQAWLQNRRYKDHRLQRLRQHAGERAHAALQEQGVCAPQAAPGVPASQEDPVLPASPVLPVTAARMQEPGFPTGSSLSPSAPRKRTRRQRTVFSAQQLRVLEEFFEGKPHGTYEERETLAARLNLQEHQVQVWLKNRRAKDHRLQRLGREEGQGAPAAPQEPAVSAPRPRPAPAGPASQKDPVLPAGPVFPVGPVLLDGPALPAATLHHGGPGFCRLPPHRPLQVFPTVDPSASRCLLHICLSFPSMAKGCRQN